MKNSVSSRVAGYFFAVLMLAVSAYMFCLTFVWWGRNTPLSGVTATAGMVALAATWFHLWIGRKTSRIWAYTERLWWETHRIHEGANGEWTLCGTCQRQPEEQPNLPCEELPKGVLVSRGRRDERDLEHPIPREEAYPRMLRR